ncbi:Transposase (fragment) [Mycobacterium canettii CIPT 140070017]
MVDRIAPRFPRYEPLRHASELMLGMVSGLDRKNCWTIAEHRGDATPDGLQHLLARAKWDADGVRDDLRNYVIDASGGILVVDETGDVKKGVHLVGVQRQYTGTAGRVENTQVAVFLTYAAPRGHALIDRALYLPRSWAEDPQRCTDAGIPTTQRCFATKPTLATALIARAVAAKVPAAWVAGDEVYGADPKLRAAIRGHGLGYVLAVSANRRVPPRPAASASIVYPPCCPSGPGRSTPPARAATDTATTPGPGSRWKPRTTPTRVTIIC